MADRTDPDDLADESSLVFAARADLNAFAPLYERYAPRLYAYCLRRVADPQEAEDLTSLVFTRALASLEQYRGGLVSAWLFQIAHHAVLDHWAKRRRQPAPLALDEIDLPDDSAEPFEQIARDEETRRLRALVDALPEEQQHLLAMRLSGQLSAEAIGQALGKSAGAVRVALHRLLRLLHARYQETNGQVGKTEGSATRGARDEDDTPAG